MDWGKRKEKIAKQSQPIILLGQYWPGEFNQLKGGYQPATKSRYFTRKKNKNFIRNWVREIVNFASIFKFFKTGVGRRIKFARATYGGFTLKTHSLYHNFRC